MDGEKECRWSRPDRIRREAKSAIEGCLKAKSIDFTSGTQVVFIKLQRLQPKTEHESDTNEYFYASFSINMPKQEKTK